MIRKAALVTGLILAVAVLAFAGLAIETVPVSTSETLTETHTETGTSYSPYVETNIVSYTSTSIQASFTNGLVTPSPMWPCSYPGIFPTICIWTTTTTTGYVSGTQTLQSAYAASMTSTIPYYATHSNTLTESSTTDVPASAAIGLTDVSFAVLAVVVIGILVLLTVYAIMKTKHH